MLRARVKCVKGTACCWNYCPSTPDPVHRVHDARLFRAVEKPKNPICRFGFEVTARRSPERFQHGSRLQKSSPRSKNLIYGTIRHSSLFVETEFLSLAQAVESLHRLTDRSTIVEPRLFKQILKALCRFIPTACGDSPIVDCLLDRIRHANEPKFQSRIESLLSGIHPNRIAKLVGDPVVFEKTLRQTRNYFTHPGIRKQENVLTDPKKIYGSLTRSCTSYCGCGCSKALGFRKTKYLNPSFSSCTDGPSRMNSARF
jgi:hypothetical protein